RRLAGELLHLPAKPAGVVPEVRCPTVIAKNAAEESPFLKRSGSDPRTRATDNPVVRLPRKRCGRGPSGGTPSTGRGGWPPARAAEGRSRDGPRPATRGPR